MRRAYGTGLLVLLLVALAAPAAGAAEPLERQVGRTLALRFAGPTLPASARDALARGRAGGVILFGDNVRSARQLRGLTAAIRRAGGADTLISTDQEGGLVRRLPFAAPTLSQPRQTSTAIAGGQARAAARDLRAAGIDVNLAPVADVPSVPGAFIRSRAFPGDARGVARLTAAAVRGYAGSGVAATVKHFPGLGASAVNTDERPATVDRPRSALERVDLAPFRAAIAARVPLVMASHARYPALDARHIASQSRAILRGLLRRQLGFGGVIITDGLEARAVTARSSVPNAALRSLRAGADLLLLTAPSSHRPTFARLLNAARRSRGVRVRVADAAARVAALTPSRSA